MMAQIGPKQVGDDDTDTTDNDDDSDMQKLTMEAFCWTSFKKIQELDGLRKCVVTMILKMKFSNIKYFKVIRGVRIC
jgi:hypothetical protein